MEKSKLKVEVLNVETLHPKLGSKSRENFVSGMRLHPETLKKEEELEYICLHLFTNYT